MTLHSSRPDARTDLLHGALDMLIHRTLQWGPQHGYAIGQTIRAQSSDVLQVEAGSLYPALQAYRPSMILHTQGPAPADVLVDRARVHITNLDSNLPVQYARKLSDHMKGTLLLFNLTATMLVVFGAAGISSASTSGRTSRHWTDHRE